MNCAVRPREYLASSASSGAERIVERVHEQPAHDVDHHDLLAARRLEQVGAPARRAGRKVDRPQQALVLRDIGDDLALVPDVVAGGDAVDARLVQLGADLGGDAEARGGVLAVDHHEIEAELLAQPRHFFDHRVAAGHARRCRHKTKPSCAQTKAQARLSVNSQSSR